MSAPGTPLSTGEWFGRAVLAFIVYEVTLIGAAWSFGVREIDGSQPASVELAAVAMATGLLVALAAFRGGRDVIGVWDQRQFGKALALYGLFMGFWVPTALIAYPVILGKLEVTLSPQPFVAYFANGEFSSLVGLIAAVAVSCVLAPLVEEIVFRGYIQTALGRVLPKAVAVLVTATVFGLMHGIDYAIPVGLLGVCFGALRERFDSVAVAVMAHVFHNSVTVAVNAVFPQMFEWVYSR